MSQRKSVLLSCLGCLGILVLLGVLGQLDLKGKEIEFASDYGELQLYVEYPFGTEAINIWQGEEGYYFFLPSNARGVKLGFGNLRKGDSVSIGGQAYGRGEDMAGALPFGTACEMRLCVGGEELEARQVTFMRSENIPAVFLETASGTVENIHTDKSIKEEASVVILDQNGGCEYRGGIEYVKARGNSTFFGTDKKSYQVKLYQKKQLFGMGEAKKWILLANAKDDSLIRNKLVYDFAADYTEVPSIEGVYVDLYMNGDYAGNYFLCEKVEISRNRLDITDLASGNEAVNGKGDLENGAQYVSEDGRIRAVAGLKNPADITGGYLIEKDTEGEFSQARSGFRTQGGQYYCVVEPENASVEQVEYICGLFDELELAIDQPDGVNPETGKHFSEYLDVDSWVEKFLMDEVFSDPDTPASSTYFYKDADSADPLIHSGPMWDYDRAFGGYSIDLFFIDDPLQMGYRGVYAEGLLGHQEVMEQILEEYQRIILPYVDNELGWRIVSNQRELAASAEMDRLRWPGASGYFAGWEANGAYLRAFLEKKVEYLNEIWLQDAQYHTVTFLDYYGNACDVYRVKHGGSLPQVPEISAYTAIFSGWYSTASGKRLDVRRPVLEDEVYRSDWIEMDMLLLNGLDMAQTELEGVDIEALERFVELLKERQENGFE